MEWIRADFGLVLDQKATINVFNEENQYAITKYVLPNISAEKFPFLIEAKLPSYGWLGNEFAISYEITNKLEKVLEIECSLDENEYFGLAGKKLASLIT